MNESSVTAERGINSGIRSSEVEIVDTDDLHEGGFGIVKRVLAILRRSSSSRERTHAIPMVYKRYHSLNKPEDAEILRNIPRVYQLLRDLNSPDLKVVPTLRITVDGLLMTDVSEGGKNEIISNNQVASIRDRRAYIASLIERKPSMARFMSRPLVFSKPTLSPADLP